MALVAQAPLFRELCAANPRNGYRLQKLQPAEFAQAMRVSASWLESSGTCPVLGHSSKELAAVVQPAAVNFNMHACRDGMHTLAAAEALHAALPNVWGPLLQVPELEQVAGALLAFLEETGCLAARAKCMK
eukprot:gnl/TRDRNA2_/TRDRNA2_123739_c1_seq1.p1 gnl/TRDRNA2_/TRDRNA2_123739_c1~~gnl/TRDRNA2_/TRDRNA2_123739_c1_seq1.p1  ORF type:complete len:146 (-),score=27.06 gnl/TRDRNA2_/TRDRNA2_123739_c1_seq1:38-430(-)